MGLSSCCLCVCAKACGCCSASRRDLRGFYTETSPGPRPGRVKSPVAHARAGGGGEPPNEAATDPALLARSRAWDAALQVRSAGQGVHTGRGWGPTHGTQQPGAAVPGCQCHALTGWDGAWRAKACLPYVRSGEAVCVRSRALRGRVRPWSSSMQRYPRPESDGRARRSLARAEFSAPVRAEGPQAWGEGRAVLGAVCPGSPARLGAGLNCPLEATRPCPTTSVPAFQARASSPIIRVHYVARRPSHCKCACSGRRRRCRRGEDMAVALRGPRFGQEDKRSGRALVSSVSGTGSPA